MIAHRQVTRASLNSLTVRCIQTICQHPKSIDQVSSEEIPACLKEEIVNYIMQQGKGVSVVLLSKLLHNISSIDWWMLSDASSFTAGDMRLLFSSTVSTYNHLTDVSIGGSWMFESCSLHVLELLFHSLNLSQLKRLCIQQITMNQFIMILKKCSQLETLEIKQPCINDTEIVSISRQVDQFNCARVTKLSLPSSLSDTSIVIVTRLFPAIKCLNVSRFQYILQKSAQNDFQDNKLQNTFINLLSLTITQPLTCDDISLLVKVCPRLQHVSLSIQKCMDISSLSQLKCLSSLELSNCVSSPVSFREKVACVLQTIGCQLQCLTLEYFDEVSLQRTVQLCPRLKSLSIQWFNKLEDDQSESSRDSLPHLYCLESLRIRPNPSYRVNEWLLHFICTANQQIQHLELHSCDINSADFPRMHKLHHLRCLIYRKCSSMTKAQIDQLTMSLDKLRYFVCDESVLGDH